MKNLLLLLCTLIIVFFKIFTVWHVNYENRIKRDEPALASAYIDFINFWPTAVSENPEVFENFEIRQIDSEDRDDSGKVETEVNVYPKGDFTKIDARYYAKVDELVSSHEDIQRKYDTLYRGTKALSIARYIYVALMVVVGALIIWCIIRIFIRIIRGIRKKCKKPIPIPPSMPPPIPPPLPEI